MAPISPHRSADIINWTIDAGVNRLAAENQSAG